MSPSWVAAAWMAHLDVERGLAESTRVAYQRHLRRYISYLTTVRRQGSPEHVGSHVGVMRVTRPKNAPLRHPEEYRHLLDAEWTAETNGRSQA